MSEAFTNAAMALMPGQLSPVVEAPEGFYIIYCVSSNEPERFRNSNKEVYISAQAQGKLQELLNNPT